MKSFYRHIFLSFGIITGFLTIFQCQSPKPEISPLGKMVHPADNANSEAKIELGRKLFFDKSLSFDYSISCASCHDPKYAFTDRKKVSMGVNNRLSQRNTPSILNAGYLETIMYDAHLPTLEMQVSVPIQEHVEMGMTMSLLIKRLQKKSEYQEAARSIFNRNFDAWVLSRSLATFERSLISDNSNFDKFYYGDQNSALSESAKRGWKIFSEDLYCTKCHEPPHFTTFTAENNGLYKEYLIDQGRFRIHHDSNDIGKFKTPSLRNVELTFPYMHDGSISNLDEVLEHYSKGGEGHKLQSPIIKPFRLTVKDKTDLKSFLFSLTDTSYLIDY